MKEAFTWKQRSTSDVLLAADGLLETWAAVIFRGEVCHDLQPPKLLKAEVVKTDSQRNRMFEMEVYCFMTGLEKSAETLGHSPPQRGL